MTTCVPCQSGLHGDCEAITEDLLSDHCACWEIGHDGRTMLVVDIPGIPQPQGSKVANGFGGVRDANKKLRPWRNEAMTAIWRETQRRPPIAEPVVLHAEFYFSRPRSHYGTGRNEGVLRPSAPTFHTQKPDLDKLVRAVGDALTEGGAIRDDCIIANIDTGKYWTIGPPHSLLIVKLASDL